MIHRFIETVRHLRAPSPFESYLGSVQRSRRQGLPTAQEARQDYRKVIGHDSPLTG